MPLTVVAPPVAAAPLAVEVSAGDAVARNATTAAADDVEAVEGTGATLACDCAYRPGESVKLHETSAENSVQLFHVNGCNR